MSSFKLYRYINPEHHPISTEAHPGHIIFPQQLNTNLPKKVDLRRGERRRSTYYDRVVDNRYIEPIVKIDYAFHRDEFGLVHQKLQTISWMLENEKWSSSVQTDRIPVVSEAEKLLEIKRRRLNIVTELKSLGKKYSTPEFDLSGKTLEIFEEFQLLINSYVDAGSTKLRNAFLTNKAEWLDEVNPVTGNKPRDIFVAYFSIGVQKQNH